MLGKLTWAAIPFEEPIPLIVSGILVLVILGVLGWITVKGYWPYLWREWITSVDHKRIGVMYVLLALVMSTSFSTTTFFPFALSSFYVPYTS